MKSERLFTEERREKIKELIIRDKSVYVESIVEQFGVSAVTVRKDLKALEELNVLIRTHGGAMVTDNATFDPPLAEKQKVRTKEKIDIARQACQLVNEGDVIILDNGSTSTFIARELKIRKGITIITNAVNIAWELASSNLQIILTGGNLREGSFSLLGPIAEASLKDISADRYFMSVDAIDFQYGFTTPNIQETRMSQLMMKAAQEVIVVADSSKFGQRRIGVIAPIQAVQGIITNNDISQETQQRVNDLGVKLYRV